MMVHVPSVLGVIFPLGHSGGVLGLPGIHGLELGLDSLSDFGEGFGLGGV